MGTETIERPDTRTSDPGLEEGKRAHVIRKEDEMLGYALGQEITALCGHRFIPTRDPEKFPLCEECKAILEHARGS
jgi:hypothetical protein